ncbi:MAG: hypothetical protein A3I05_05485 [Deltaproteobacteria bacterium RIFCSPLOWO2_02_FULL_44_10]|nr:MAG: hypothetical protein A3C46_06235 [Deltaproteobacteria bacterium RIFCSPHIGHO2_02_FULL_44_16]OGQ46036.1 MAG: hypothetical protein A3I05_05485 [Deltaproteobacteria bacterium RIFCSPLOWO2_02_FULL_44_10]
MIKRNVNLMMALSIIVASLLFGVIHFFSQALQNGIRLDLQRAALLLVHERLEEMIALKTEKGFDALKLGESFDETYLGDFAFFRCRTKISEVTSSDFVTPQVNSGYKRIEVNVEWGEEKDQHFSLATMLSRY